MLQCLSKASSISSPEDATVVNEFKTQAQDRRVSKSIKSTTFLGVSVITVVALMTALCVLLLLSKQLKQREDNHNHNHSYRYTRDLPTLAYFDSSVWNSNFITINAIPLQKQKKKVSIEQRRLGDSGSNSNSNSGNNSHSDEELLLMGQELLDRVESSLLWLSEESSRRQLKSKGKGKGKRKNRSVLRWDRISNQDVHIMHKLRNFLLQQLNPNKPNKQAAFLKLAKHGSECTFYVGREFYA